MYLKISSFDDFAPNLTQAGRQTKLFKTSMGSISHSFEYTFQWFLVYRVRYNYLLSQQTDIFRASCQ